MVSARLLVLLPCSLVAALGCATVMPKMSRLGEPPPGGLERLRAEAGPGAPSAEWAAPPLAVERALAADFEVRAGRELERGKTNPWRLTLFSPLLDRELRVKWKPAKPDLDGINNSPRKEIAAYRIQELVLDPSDYLVPTTDLVCLELDAIPEHRLAGPTLPGSRCAMGILSAWLDDIRHPEAKIEKPRFWSDPVYAYHAANLNVVLILMDHSDSHRRNLLESEDQASRRLFAIDNGITFNSLFRNLFIRDWNRIRVPALRREAIERLRGVGREEVTELLGVVAQVERGADGIYRSVEHGPNLDPDQGVRISGDVVQMGLTTSEIEHVWDRRRRLLAAVDAGKVPLF